MKSSLFFSILFFLTASVFAQDLPNGGFENWEKGVFDVEQPKGWFTSSLLVPHSVKKPVTKVEGFSGKHAIKLETVADKSSGNEEIIPGWAISGKFDLSTLQFGFPYDSRPSKMMFRYKYAPYPNDTMKIMIQLSKYIPGYGQMLVGYGFLESAEAVDQYTIGEIDIYYEYSDQPDTAVVIIQSGVDTLHAGSILYVDDMQFGFALSSSSKNNALLEKFTVRNPYPQPAKNGSEINFPLFLNEAGCVNIEIYDLAGRLVGRKEENLTPGAATIKYPANDLKAGMYMYSLTLKGQAHNGKIIISE